jgi:dihydroorotate dehydrogenase electron transfer subunit
LNQIEAAVTSNISFFPESGQAMDQRVSDVRLMWLECPEIAAGTRPGQFVMVRCGDLPLPRPLSVHQVKNDRIALFFAVLADGKGTRWLGERRAGDAVQILGPLGHGFSIDPSASGLVLIAGGMGMAPLYFLAQQALSRRLKVTLLIGARTGKLLYPRHLLPPGILVAEATDDGSSGQSGLVTSLIAGHVTVSDQVCACGPAAMYRQMGENGQSLGLGGKRVQVSLESFMGCGHGVCYGCTIRTRHGLRQVCKDGPVFELDDVIWEWTSAADRGSGRPGEAAAP